jgi:hypothetical protein
VKLRNIGVAWTLALAGVAAMGSMNSVSAATQDSPNTAISAAAQSQQPQLIQDPGEDPGKGHKRPDQKTVRAVVTSNGTLVATQSFGAISATRVESPVGTYQVCFNVPITNGTYVATVGLPGNVGASQPGEITTVGRFGTNNCLFIQTFSSGGQLADRSFHVTVTYSKPKFRDDFR